MSFNRFFKKIKFFFNKIDRNYILNIFNNIFKTLEEFSFGFVKFIFGDGWNLLTNNFSVDIFKMKFFFKDID